ncbi:MAG TPA: threonine--tRNA ligase, partial [Verrucomicrobiota bacterium]|nr:threonine--tRNA ligase [Verrucomicrobiota bacterium]
YYKGDEKNPQVQRVYGIAFKNKTQLDEWLEMQEEAKKRDHRKIGVEMGLFVIDPDYTGPGMPLWLPNGTVLVEELEKLAKETEFAAGYRRVRTPHLAKERMYRTSGHLPYYAESMFPPMEMHETAQVPAPESKDAPPPVDRYYLKAMNCPHHHRIFAAEPRSYRDLPLRLAEYGCCYRYEQSGELFGLMRVRSLNMNDAHIYCTEDQFAQEFNAVNDMYLKYFKIFGIEKYVMRFSTHGKEGLGKKYVNEPELWVKTEEMVRQVLIDSKINYIEVPNEAAFYGPKIDVQVWSVIGREFTLATNQVDFAVPAKFGLTYRDRDNTDKTPLCIHRAPLGTHERFIGFLIEHYAGNFPLWLAPEQVRVLPVTEAQIDYAKGIVDELRAQQVRAEIEFSNDKLMGRIQRAEAARVHHILVVGGREREANAVAVRIHGKGQQGVRPRSEVVAEILESIRERRF